MGGGTMDRLSLAGCWTKHFPRCVTLYMWMAVDSDLLLQIETAYRTGFRRFYRVAFGILRDDDLAWDAVQEGFAGAIRGRAGFRGDAPLEAWLWRAVVNAATRIASQRRMNQAESEIPDAPESIAPSERVDLGVLTERQRLIVFLRYYADLDHQTIGQILGIERGTVSATLHTAREALRRDLEVPR